MTSALLRERSAAPTHWIDECIAIEESRDSSRQEIPIFVVANREIVTVTPELEVQQSSGGLATGLKDLLKKPDNVTICSWEIEQNDTIPISSINALKRSGELGDFPYNLVGVPVSESEKKGYYADTANGDLWPLLHTLPEHRQRAGLSSWESYRLVNKRFAETILRDARSDSYIWIHDYHLLFVPQLVRDERPDANLGFFLHIPWPDSAFLREHTDERIRREILKGMLGSDLIGFQTKRDASNFLHLLAEEGFEVDFYAGEVRALDGRTVFVGTFPISIDYHGIREIVQSEEVKRTENKMRDRYTNEFVFFGVERLDFTKGLAERFLAIRTLLSDHRDLIGKIKLRQHVDVGRQDVSAYRKYRDELRQIVDNVNSEFRCSVSGKASWQPIDYIEQKLSREEILGYGRASQVWIVTPICDGMNLVAKELAAAKDPVDVGSFLSSAQAARDDISSKLGTGILGRDAGASEELGDFVFSVDGSDPNDVARAMFDSMSFLHSSPEQAARNLNALHDHLQTHTIQEWSKHFLTSFQGAVSHRHVQPSK